MERKSGVMPIHLSDTAKKDLSLRGAKRRSNPHYMLEIATLLSVARNDNLFWRRRLDLWCTALS